MYFNNNFEKRLKEISVRYSEELLDTLMDFLESNIARLENKNYNEILNREVVYNPQKAREHIYKYYLKSGIHFLYYNHPNDWRMPLYSETSDFTDDEHNLLNAWDQNVREEFWSNIDKDEFKAFENMSSFKGFEDREPKTFKEQVKLQNNVISQFPITKEWTKYHDQLIKYFNPDYILQSKFSNPNKKRYVLRNYLDKKYATAIYVDRGAFISEVKNGFVQCPDMSIEIFSTEMDKYYNIGDYTLEPNQKIPLRKVYIRGMNGVLSLRLKEQFNEESMKQELFLKTKIRSEYLSMSLKYIQKLLDELND